MPHHIFFSWQMDMDTGATLETEICGQRLSTARPPMSRRDSGIDLADRLLPPQVAGMSRYSAD
jgi:hypothetical protein